jgi:hypothetical protein
MEPPTSPSTDNNTVNLTLQNQKLRIPNLLPAFTSWKQGVNPLHARVKLAVDARLEGLLGHDEVVLAKVRAADIGLIAAGYVFVFLLLS